MQQFNQSIPGERDMSHNVTHASSLCCFKYSPEGMYVKYVISDLPCPGAYKHPYSIVLLKVGVLFNL